MKTKIFAIMIISIIINCQKESNSNTLISKSDILGTWVNASNNIDTIIINNSDIRRWYPTLSCYCHTYSYSLKNDSLLLNYTGIDKIFCTVNEVKIFLNKNKDTLEIQNFHSICPGGNTDDYFIKIKNQ